MHWKSGRAQSSYVHCCLQFWSNLSEGHDYKKSWFAKEERQESYLKNWDFKNTLILRQEIKPWHSLVNFLQMKLQLRRKNLSILKVKSNVLMNLYFNDFKVHENYPAFSTLLKIIFSLSHGQASVERGFNDNNVVLKDDISVVSVIKRRSL